MQENVVEIYCDGACSGNPGPGGWGAVLLWKGVEREISGHEELTTNNRMELTAAIKALEHIKRPTKIIIHTDSTYLKNGMNTWLHKWKSSNWNKGKIKNVDLWQKLDGLNQKLDIEWRYVKAHNGHKYNEKADQLARNAIIRP